MHTCNIQWHKMYITIPKGRIEEAEIQQSKFLIL